MDNNKNLLKEVSDNVKNWKDISISLGFKKDSFDNGFIFFQSISWLLIKFLLSTSNNEETIKHIERLFPQVTTTQCSFLDLEFQELKKQADNMLVIPKKICQRISQWRAFGRVLNFEEHQLNQIEKENTKFYDRAYSLMKQFCHPLPVNESWSYWRKYLLQFIEGRKIINDMEAENLELIDVNLDSIVHHGVIGRNGLLFHHHVAVEKYEPLPFSHTKLIGVNVGGNQCKLLHYQDYQEFINTKTKYFDIYEAISHMKTYDFTGNCDRPCPILQSFQSFLEETKYNGFACKGYSLRNHYNLFGEKVFSEETINNNILAYIANDNVLIHTKICDNIKSIPSILSNLSKEVQICQSVHKCIINNPIIHIGVVLVEDMLLKENHISCCFQCVKELLILPKSDFFNSALFKKWYKQVIACNDHFKQVKEVIFIKSVAICLDILKELKVNILSFMALKSYDFPTFTPVPEYQMKELEKVVLLTANQMNIVYSSFKHIVIKGGYGSGKSLVLQERFKHAVENSDDSDIFYLVCHDQMSKFHEQMKLLKRKYPAKKILIFSGRLFTLPQILKLAKAAWKKKRIHFFIDEFNGSHLDQEEVFNVKAELSHFSDCHIVIAAQSMEYKVVNEEKQGFRFDLLCLLLDFKFFYLNSSLRCSKEISGFVSDSVKSFEAIEVRCCIPFDDWDKKEVDLQVCLEYKGNGIEFILLCDYTQPSNTGHNVCCGKVQMYEITKIHKKFFELSEEQKFLAIRKNEHFVDSIASSVEQMLVSDFYQKNLILYHLLQKLQEKIVICCFDKEMFDDTFLFLQKSECNFTTDIPEYNEKDYRILLTDYGSVRGFEFSTFICLLDLHELSEKLAYKLIECVTRATSNLHLIVSLDDSFKSSDIFKCWKTCKFVEWNELCYDDADKSFYIKRGDGEKVLIDSDISQPLFENTSIDADLKKNLLRYEWPKFRRPKVDNLEDDILSVACLAIFSNNDDVDIFEEFLKIHYSDNESQLQRSVDYKGSLLHFVAPFNCGRICSMIIDKYPSLLNALNWGCDSPLCIAIEENAEKSAFVLLDAGCECICEDEITLPLHYAVSWNSYKVVSLLLDLGYDVTAKDDYGKTPLDYAIELNNVMAFRKTINILKEGGALVGEERNIDNIA